jgi:hypothetical protein
MPDATFATVSALIAVSPGRFSADVSPKWTIDGKPNGGYLLAMLGRAASEVVSQRHVIAASAHFLHPPEPGAVTIEAEQLRAGRTASQVRARMSQRGTPCVEALLTVGSLSPETTAFWTRGLPVPEFVPQDGCVRLPPRTPTGGALPIMEQIDLRVEPATLQWAAGKPSGTGELRGWLELAGGEAFDPTSLLFAVDAFPPATFDIAPTGWVPTLELTAYIRALPVAGPVRILQKAQVIDAQRVDEVCLVWDQTGRLVAQCTQLAGIRVG